MRVISTNIGKPTTFEWNGETRATGIYKYPVDHPLILEKESVAGDFIGNPKVHGGFFKACYLFSADHYPYWKERYPHLSWNWGMFGENLTVAGLDEAKIRIGNIYTMGTALVQITQPREPCYKLGIKFGTQKILRQFIEHGFPGTYVRVLKIGHVKKGDMPKLIEESKNPLTIKQFYGLLFSKEKDPELLGLALKNEAIPLGKCEKLRNGHKKRP